MGTPFPPEEPFGEDGVRGAEEQTEKRVEEVRREHEAKQDGTASGDSPTARVPWWRRLFNRS